MTILTLLSDFTVQRDYDDDGNPLDGPDLIVAHDCTDNTRPLLNLDGIPKGMRPLTYDEVTRLRAWLNDWLGHHRQ